MTNLTEQELAEAVAKIAELEQKTLPDGVMDAQSLGHNIFMFREESYTMASIIRQLWAEREASRVVMMKAREVITVAQEAAECFPDVHDGRVEPLQIIEHLHAWEGKYITFGQVAGAEKALTELNIVLGDGND